MASGGVVMWALAGLCVLYWTLVFERIWFIRRVFPRWVESRRQAWSQLGDEPGNWQRAVRGSWLAQAQQQLSGPLRLRSEEHTSELQSRENLVCRLLLEKKN